MASRTATISSMQRIGLDSDTKKMSCVIDSFFECGCANWLLLLFRKNYFLFFPLLVGRRCPF